MTSNNKNQVLVKQKIYIKDYCWTILGFIMYLEVIELRQFPHSSPRKIGRLIAQIKS